MLLRIILMRANATEQQVDDVLARIRKLGGTGQRVPGTQRLAISVTGNLGSTEPAHLARWPGVADLVPMSRSFKLVSRVVKVDDTVVRLEGNPRVAQFGGGKFGVIAGPCAVEGREQMLAAAEAVKAGGACALRGGAYKPRTSPYSFQGMKEEGLALLAGRASAPACPSSPRWWTPPPSSSSPRTPTCCRSARATCRTSRCSRPWAPSASR